MVQEQPTLRQVSSCVKQLSRLLIECGCSSNRVEKLVAMLVEKVGYEADIMATPTAAWISVRSEYEQRVELVRVKKWSLNLALLSEINRLVKHFLRGSVQFNELTDRIQNMEQFQAPYSSWMQVVAGGVASGAIMVILGGERFGIALAVIIGALAKSFAEFFISREERRYLADFSTSFLVASLALLGSRILPIPSWEVPKLITSGLILMVPGLVFVNAVHEVAQKNLVSGSAKVMEASMIGLSLAFGVGMCFGLLEVLKL